MKLIGAGLPRTATLSQKVALETLGLGPCYHMVNVLGDLDEMPAWRRTLDGNQRPQDVLNGYQSTVDWPGGFFYQELMEAYPNAKVLLSVRDGEKWERSMRDTIWGVLYGDNLPRDLSNARSRVDPKWRAYIEMMNEMWNHIGIQADAAPGEIARAGERFNDEVKRTVPPDRLLVWSARDGWDPLCRFLELPVPNMPFPHLNDSEAFGERVVDGALLALQEWRTPAAAPVPAM